MPASMTATESGTTRTALWLSRPRKTTAAATAAAASTPAPAARVKGQPPAAARGGHLAGGRGALLAYRRLELGILAKDRGVEPLELRARLDPERLDEHLPSRAVRLERVRLAAAPVLGEHQLPAHPLAKRMHVDDCSLGLGDGFAWRPSSSSSSKHSSRTVSRNSESAGRAPLSGNGSNARSDSGSPRQRSSASRILPCRERGLRGCVLLRRTRALWQLAKAEEIELGCALSTDRVARRRTCG